jgi:Skp family chaperone for outer membrane proteins
MTTTTPRTLALVAVVLAGVALLVAAPVSARYQNGNSASNGIATVDLLTLLEDMLQTEDFKPSRDAYREEWESRLDELQQRLQQIETELRMSSPQDPNVRALQQQYQQTGFEFQQVQREASMGFDQFNAEQAAEAYGTLHTAAVGLAEELGYSHLVVSREQGEITERGNLATVTQEILARPIVLSPDADDLTARLRERLSIPVPPEPAEAVTDGAEPVTPAGDEVDGE